MNQKTDPANQKTDPAADRQPKAHPLFVELFLAADADEDPEDGGRARRRGGRQKRVIRNS